MARIPLTLCVLVAVVLSSLPIAVVAQGPPPGPPPPPELGNAVVLGTNSVRIDRDTVVLSGDLVVNHANPGPFLGSSALSIAQSVTTPSGFALKANGIVIDSGAVIGGEVRYNVLQNDGTINGALVTPLALPVISTIPPIPNRAAGTTDITVPDGATQIIGTGGGVGLFGHLVIGRNATVRFPGGPYSFASITADRGASMIWEGPGDIVVKGRLTLGADVTIAPAPGVTTKRRMYFVEGINGLDGLLTSTPPAVSIGKNSSITASIYAPNGSILAGAESYVFGALLGRDVHIGRESRLELRSGFRNLPPVAISANWEAGGTSPTPITLTGFDPDNDPLTFSIIVQPTKGTLSAVTQAGPTSAVVVYTPNVADPDDSFVFRVTDSEGFTGNGVITINNGAPPPPPTTVTAEDATVEVRADRLSIVTLPAVAPPAVAITLSIVPASGPSHGSLGPLQQPTLMPPRSGSVPYIPAPGYTGSDSFSFRACGTISGNQVCDEGTITLNVVAPPTEGDNLAQDFNLTASSNTVTAINLSPTPQLPEEETGGESVRLGVRTHASVLKSAEVAGNVADANGDGFGDNANALPGPTPILMSAGVGQSGGPGSNGTTRIHFEWEIASVSELAENLESATVLLRTRRGTTDSLDTRLYVVAGGDGLLTADDFERGGEPLRSVVMPVPQGQPVGADGLFSFDVLEAVRTAISLGLTHFSLQGRVNETLAGPANGLQVYTTADGNGPQQRPQLGLATRAAPSRVYRILSLPANGTLRDSNGVLITAAPYTLPSSFVFYRSASGFTGQNTFNYELTAGPLSDTGTVTITVIAGDCAVDPAFCEGGRD